MHQKRTRLLCTTFGRLLAVQRVFRIVDRQPVIDASSPEGIQPENCVGAIELMDITFAYPARPEVGSLLSTHENAIICLPFISR